MKKLLLLLLFIPLVSFGQSQLGKTKGYVLSECNKNENCEINKNENDVVEVSYRDGFGNINQSETFRLGSNNLVDLYSLRIHKSDMKGMYKMDLLFENNSMKVNFMTSEIISENKKKIDFFEPYNGWPGMNEFLQSTFFNGDKKKKIKYDIEIESLQKISNALELSMKTNQWVEIL